MSLLVSGSASLLVARTDDPQGERHVFYVTGQSLPDTCLCLQRMLDAVVCQSLIQGHESVISQEHVWRQELKKQTQTHNTREAPCL